MAGRFSAPCGSTISPWAIRSDANQEFDKEGSPHNPGLGSASPDVLKMAHDSRVETDDDVLVGELHFDSRDSGVPTVNIRTIARSSADQATVVRRVRGASWIDTCNLRWPVSRTMVGRAKSSGSKWVEVRLIESLRILL